MPVQRTLVLLKPDTIQRGRCGEILTRFECKGLRMVGVKMLIASREIAERHYAEHKGKPFYEKLLAFITSSPLMAVALEGDEAVVVVRNLVGPTDGRAAPPGTIRGDYALSKSNNLVHASDSLDSAAREIGVWFPEGLVTWERSVNVWVESP